MISERTVRSKRASGDYVYADRPPTRQLTHFDAEFWCLGAHTPIYPLIAACADIQLSLALVRFIQDPSLLAHKGTTAVEAAYLRLVKGLNNGGRKTGLS